jgi:hypothetical protein
MRRDSRCVQSGPCFGLLRAKVPTGDVTQINARLNSVALRAEMDNNSDVISAASR